MGRTVYKLGNAALVASVLAAPAIVHMDAYANTLTRLIPDLYQGMDVASRLLIGIIPGVTRNVSAERAAVGQSIVTGIAPPLPAFDIAPSMTTPEPADFVMGNDTFAITKARGVAFGITGEEQRGLNTGAGWITTQAQLFSEALKTLTDEIESDLATEIGLHTSRAWGTAGTTPFGASHAETAQVRKILDDNGAPGINRSLVIDTAAGANLRSLANLTRVNESGTQMTLRDGELLNLNGFSVRESGQIKRPLIGTAAGATTNTAGYAEGATVINLAAAGTGTILPGDVITFAGDTNKYTVETGVGAVSGGQIRLVAPGLRVAIPAAATALSVVARSVRNLAFVQSAVHLAARAPALPQEGDAAIERMMLTDPRSGIAYEVSIYAGYRKIRAEVALCWGVKSMQGRHTAALLG